jgi:IS30 family transposase
VFFCNPYASYERGLNEYINNIKQARNIEIMDLLNKRPRKKLNFKTPEKEFFTMFNLENKKLAFAS